MDKLSGQQNVWICYGGQNNYMLHNMLNDVTKGSMQHNILQDVATEECVIYKYLVHDEV